MRCGLLMLALALAVGCKQPNFEEQAPPPPETIVEEWRERADKLVAEIRPGMAQEEVLKIAGEPTEHMTIFAGESQEIWDYMLAPRISFRVVFDSRDRVIRAGIHGENIIGG